MLPRHTLTPGVGVLVLMAFGGWTRTVLAQHGPPYDATTEITITGTSWMQVLAVTAGCTVGSCKLTR